MLPARDTGDNIRSQQHEGAYREYDSNFPHAAGCGLYLMHLPACVCLCSQHPLEQFNNDASKVMFVGVWGKGEADGGNWKKNADLLDDARPHGAKISTCVSLFRAVDAACGSSMTLPTHVLISWNKIYSHIAHNGNVVYIGPGDILRGPLSTVKNALLDINAKIWKLSVLPCGQPMRT